MGAWGTGIYEDDIASDVRAEFSDALEAGRGVAAATQIVLETFAEHLEDPDDGPIVILALAQGQVEARGVQPEIRSKALAIIASGSDLERWEGPARAERAAVLEELKRRLTGP